MKFENNLLLKLHNWRRFDSIEFSLPKESFAILDKNGSGKTSLISSFYSLFTGQSWPTTRLAHHLKSGTEYFGVSCQYPDWSFTGQISPSGRVVSKYRKLPPDYYEKLFVRVNSSETVQKPKILTYLPTDNYWFNQSRGNKLDILDNLLNQIFESAYKVDLQNLHKLVKHKHRLIKHVFENPDNFDQALLSTLNKSILTHSHIIWSARYNFLKYLDNSLVQFEQLIESPFRDWKVRWEVSDSDGAKKSYYIRNLLNPLKYDELDWSVIWQKELLIGKVLFGAQRDDFRITSNHLGVEEVLSRGEMRLLVLFIKNIARQYLYSLNSNQPVFWLLDDVFNEFDLDRERIVADQLLKQTDYYIITSTTHSLDSVLTLNINDLTNRNG
ncbi:MAG: hypothetical protein AAGF07_02730 [Patescibacteria group bacterium]